jgi:hypothetical protein
MGNAFRALVNSVIAADHAVAYHQHAAKRAGDGRGSGSSVGGALCNGAAGDHITSHYRAGQFMSSRLRIIASAHARSREPRSRGPWR